jgi:molybdopterin/thiamine biosynthesis adenylyltransferase
MRFERQLPIFGEDGQQRIMSAVVGIIGCGGLGVNVITQLVSAGVSHFILCDHQSPELSNLNRQFIYSASDYRPKSVISAEWILALNPSAEVQSNAEPLTELNGDLFKGCDILVDCLDNFESRMILSDLAEKMGVPLIHGGISGYNGQIAVVVPGKTKSLRDMIGTMKSPEGAIPSVGAAVSIIASMEALEVLKIISGQGTSNEGKLITIDMGNWTTESVQF